MFSTDPHSSMIQTSLHYRDVARSRPNEAIKVVDKPVQRGDSIAPVGRSAIEKGRVIYFSDPSLKRSDSGMGVLPVESQGRRDTRLMQMLRTCLDFPAPGHALLRPQIQLLCFQSVYAHFPAPAGRV